jgi:predicted dithiol-disulfide oxidoreductase (DUF899 family)
MSLPDVVSREEWLAARKELLVKEKELTRARDRVNADRRRLPMVRVDKEYVFDGPDGEVRLLDLFEGRRQLVLGDRRPDRQPHPPERPQHHPGGSVSCAVREHRAVPAADGLDVSVVLLGRQRLQL